MASISSSRLAVEACSATAPFSARALTTRRMAALSSSTGSPIARLSALMDSDGGRLEASARANADVAPDGAAAPRKAPATSLARTRRVASVVCNVLMPLNCRASGNTIEYAKSTVTTLGSDSRRARGANELLACIFPFTFTLGSESRRARGTHELLACIFPFTFTLGSESRRARGTHELLALTTSPSAGLMARLAEIAEMTPLTIHSLSVSSPWSRVEGAKGNPTRPTTDRSSSSEMSRLPEPAGLVASWTVCWRSAETSDSRSRGCVIATPVSSAETWTA